MQLRLVPAAPVFIDSAGEDVTVAGARALHNVKVEPLAFSGMHNRIDPQRHSHIASHALALADLTDTIGRAARRTANRTSCIRPRREPHIHTHWRCRSAITRRDVGVVAAPSASSRADGRAFAAINTVRTSPTLTPANSAIAARVSPRSCIRATAAAPAWRCS